MNSDDDSGRRVRAALARNPRVDERFIGINVNDGVVTLVGLVAHSAQRRSAAEVTGGMVVVRAVANETEFAMRAEGERSDIAIADWAARTLHKGFPEHLQPTRVEVKQRWVTPIWQVDTFYARAAAESVPDAARHAGVTSVENLLGVRP